MTTRSCSQTPVMAFRSFFIRDVEIPLRLLDVGASEHQLNRADIHSVGQDRADCRNLDPDRDVRVR